MGRRVGELSTRASSSGDVVNKYSFICRPCVGPGIHVCVIESHLWHLSNTAESRSLLTNENGFMRLMIAARRCEMRSLLPAHRDGMRDGVLSDVFLGLVRSQSVQPTGQKYTRPLDSGRVWFNLTNESVRGGRAVKPLWLAQRPTRVRGTTSRPR